MRISLVRDRALVVSVVMLAAAALSIDAAISAAGIYLKKLPILPPANRQLRAVPSVTENWKQLGSDAILPKDVVETLGTENYISRNYQRRTGEKSGQIVELHCAYYTGMVDTVPHVPDRCMVGHGWQILTSPEDVRVPLETAGWVADPDTAGTGGNGSVVYTARTSNAYSDLKGARVRLPRGIEELRFRTMPFQQETGNVQVFVGYFFVANGELATTAEQVRLKAFDLTDDYAYYLKVQVLGIKGVESREELAEAAASILGDMLPEMMRCVPDWVEVERGRYPADNPRRVEATRGT